jgi:hypothetical protein
VKKKKKRVKCKSDFVTVFPAGGGHYNRPIEEITVGNVYEVLEVVRQFYYIILPDEGNQTIELPDYMFRPTEEPVTVNRDREKNAMKKEAQRKANQKEEFARQQAQRISDNMDQFYNPEKFRKKQTLKKLRIDAISKVFVGGIPFD